MSSDINYILCIKTTTNRQEEEGHLKHKPEDYEIKCSNHKTETG